MTAIAISEREQALTRALESRTEIGIAIGILMCESRIDRHDAFRILVSASQRSNRKVRDLAAEVATAHENQIRAHPSPSHG